MSYSLDLRSQAVKFVRAGGSRTEASRVYGISRKTLYHWLRRTDLSPAPRRIRQGKIDKNKLVSHVQANPDALLRERAAAFGVTPSGMWRALRTLNIRKKGSSGK